MSDSDSDCDCCSDYDGNFVGDFVGGFGGNFGFFGNFAPQTKTKASAADKKASSYLNPSDDVIDRWYGIPADIRSYATERMKLCVFWFPILLQREDTSTISCWALEIGLVDTDDELSMKQLQKIETLEAVLRALEKGTVKKDQTKHVFLISNMFNSRSPEVLEDAIHWLERTGEPRIRNRVMDLGHVHTCFTALHFVFTEFAKYINDMGVQLQKTMNSLLAQPPAHVKNKSEEMKKKGNEKFQSQQYEEAVKFYSKAIKYYPDNHIIYGNRALCYIRCKKYLKAVGDGKRATLINPHWAKIFVGCKLVLLKLMEISGYPLESFTILRLISVVKYETESQFKQCKNGHYRYCEALYLLGDLKMAIEANKSAQRVCKGDDEGIRDLEQQHQKFVKEAEQVEKFKKIMNFKSEGANKAQAAESRPQSFKVGAVVSTAPQNKALDAKASKPAEVKVTKQSGKSEKTAQTESSVKAPKPSKSDSSSKGAKGESSMVAKKKSKNKNTQPETENPKAVNLKAAASKELKSVVQEAHTALTDLRSRNAEQSFSQALVLVEANSPKELGLSTIDVLLLLYGRASALTEIGQPEELGEAQKLLEKIKSYEERTFQCLVFYAVGKVYLRENRFAVALQQFEDSMQMVRNQITPGKLTWPLTKEIVKETQPEYLRGILETNLDLCKFPPPPDAICRMEKCLVPAKTEIYLTDPDFKGFIRLSCCQSCLVEYHIACWKTLKASPVFEKSDKDYLQESCFTPDCVGKISSIQIFGSTGLLKCKFDAVIQKPQTPKRPKVNQKCSSLKKLKSKEEHRLKRKQQKKSHQEKQVISEEVLQKKDDTLQTQQKAWQLYRDRVLLQICQRMELLREEQGLQVSTLTSSLKPWLELDLSRGNQIARRLLNFQEEQLETLGQAVELLLERKNRVWARVLIDVLSSCMEINPALIDWASHLNDAGLNAAKSFMERYAGHLEQLDLAFLLNFSPLQEVIIERLGTKPELFSSIGLTVTEYLKQAPPHDLRLFIWSLEEHRDDYDSCHTILDEYFDMMDGHYSVIKKSDDNQNNSPMKSRGRKKKHKEQRGYVLPARSVTPRDDFEQDYFEDDSLSFLHPTDPFSVPSHLREQVADFEEQYNSTRHTSHFKNVLDNNPDPTRESLYDYFAQILEEHGPLVADDPLLVGELEHFPPEAHQKIQQAGGFEAFLLESLRFIKMGRCVGLTKQALSLQQAVQGASLGGLDNLDDLDELNPDTINPASDATGHYEYQDAYSTAQIPAYPVLPSPYVFGSMPPPHVLVADGVIRGGNDYFLLYANGETGYQAPYFVPNGSEELDLYCSESEDGHIEPDSASLTVQENLLKKHESVQTCQENMRSVAMNTEPHERFESCQGDINKKQKSIKTLDENIKKMSSGSGKVDQKHNENVAVLEDDIQKITVNIQVTKTELALFQQKLEDEVKKDQNEKKANQEMLKSLKVEIEDLVEEQRSLTRNIRDIKISYQAKFNECLDLNHQSATEKSSLEDEIKRCKALFTSATRRSITAQLSVVESSQDQALYGLYREITNNKAFLSHLDGAAHRYKNQELEVTRNTVKAGVQEMEKKISTAKTQYQEQMDQVKNGRRVNELLPVNISPHHEPPAAAKSGAAANTSPPPSAQASSRSSPLTLKPGAEASSAPTQTQNKPSGRKQMPLHSNTMYDKAMERLAVIFPDYTRSELMKFVQDLRFSNGGSLSRMNFEELVGGASQLILDHQERTSSAAGAAARVGRGSPAQCGTPPPVWQSLGPQRATTLDALNAEDPCIICHEDMSPGDMCVLECRHSFHKECIRSWLKEQSTCPTCRDHALLPEEFPALSGRRRQAP